MQTTLPTSFTVAVYSDGIHFTDWGWLFIMKKYPAIQAGEKFGRLTTIERIRIQEKSGFRAYWNCKCDCGVATCVTEDNMRMGRVSSCGCIVRKHGESGNQRTIESKTWNRIIYRCYDTNAKCFPNYGGRGIKVCDRWRHSFENFLADMGRRPLGKFSIDRINNDSDYCPENCRWATRKQQNNNYSRNRLISFAGKTQNVTQWATEINIPFGTLVSRLNRGWSFEEALTIPNP